MTAFKAVHSFSCSHFSRVVRVRSLSSHTHTHTHACALCLQFVVLCWTWCIDPRLHCLSLFPRGRRCILARIGLAQFNDTSQLGLDLSCSCYATWLFSPSLPLSWSFSDHDKHPHRYLISPALLTLFTFASFACLPASLGLAWPGLAWSGLVWPGLARVLHSALIFQLHIWHLTFLLFIFCFVLFCCCLLLIWLELETGLGPRLTLLHNGAGGKGEREMYLYYMGLCLGTRHSVEFQLGQGTADASCRCNSFSDLNLILIFIRVDAN